MRIDVRIEATNAASDMNGTGVEVYPTGADGTNPNADTVRLAIISLPLGQERYIISNALRHLANKLEDGAW